MKLLPYKSFSITSQESPDIISQRLADQIEAPRRLRWSPNHNHAQYQGYIADESFKITRIIHYRNSFLPIIRGQIESIANGTEVKIKMNLHPAVLAFLGLWCSIWFGATSMLLVGHVTSMFSLGGTMSIFGVLPFIGLPLLVFTAFWFAFWFEVNKSTGDLIRIIQG